MGTSKKSQRTTNRILRKHLQPNHKIRIQRRPPNHRAQKTQQQNTKQTPNNKNNKHNTTTNHHSVNSSKNPRSIHTSPTTHNHNLDTNQQTTHTTRQNPTKNVRRSIQRIQIRTRKRTKPLGLRKNQKMGRPKHTRRNPHNNPRKLGLIIHRSPRRIRSTLQHNRHRQQLLDIRMEISRRTSNSKTHQPPTRNGSIPRK